MAQQPIDRAQDELPAPVQMELCAPRPGLNACLEPKGSFVAMSNFDESTVRSFGREWSTYDQSRLAREEKTEQRFEEYFRIFPWESLPDRAVGADVGCGSGRWAVRVAPRIGVPHCIDASTEALAVARRNLAGRANCQFHHASVGAVPLPAGSLDFCYSLGVL
ncbi:MAG: class I SAM-dependent methyltransferase, partial [Stellaceae bacterium]